MTWVYKKINDHEYDVGYWISVGYHADFYACFSCKALSGAWRLVNYLNGGAGPMPDAEGL